jgi:predicted ArsR family transcriptional regulator
MSEPAVPAPPPGTAAPPVHPPVPVTVPPLDTGASSPSALRREILLHLRRSGPSSPDALAGALGASRSGVAQQLRALESVHLVSRQTMRHGVGRPRHLYDVTAEAQALFPANYDGLATGLLAAILEVGGEALLDEVFAARRRQSETRLRDRLNGRLDPDAPLEVRVRELAAYQDELGYLAEVAEEDGALRLIEHNCAVYHAAQANPAACRAELELFRSVLGAEIERERHIAAGDRCCAYRIDPPGSASRPAGSAGPSA